MPGNPMLERLAVRKGEGATFVLPDIPQLDLPSRFLQRYPEMIEWQEEQHGEWQKWRNQAEERIQNELDQIKSEK